MLLWRADAHIKLQPMTYSALELAVAAGLYLVLDDGQAVTVRDGVAYVGRNADMRELATEAVAITRPELARAEAAAVADSLLGG